MDIQLTAQQEMVIDLLSRGMTAKAAAAQAGVSTRTVRRWKKDASFAEDLRDAIDEFCHDLIFSIEPVVREARAQVKLALDRNQEMIRGDKPVDVNRACNLASSLAIRWMKFGVAAAHAETERDVGALASAIARTVAHVPQASSLLDRQLTEPPVAHSEPNRFNAAMSISATKSTPSAEPQIENADSKIPSESGQKRTSENAPPTPQPQAAPSIGSKTTPSTPVSAPAATAPAIAPLPPSRPESRKEPAAAR
jgi:hypothetical protein